MDMSKFVRPALDRLDRLADAPIYVSPLLPMPPSNREVAEWLVRKGLEDITLHGHSLVEAGPEPSDTHCVVANPGMSSMAFFVSQEFSDRLMAEAGR